MILGYRWVEDHLASKRIFSGRLLELVNNPGYKALAPIGLVYSLIGHRIGYSHSQEVSR
jgi:hypothetical protein